MSEPFDPYFKWLGIPQNERPINYYRLLGIQQFEEDHDVISHAVDQRTAHVRTFQSSGHAKVAKRIRNEISMAGVCLLNPETKAEYDKKLKRLAEPKPAPPRLPATTAPEPTDDEGSDSAAAVAKRRMKLAIAAAGGGVAILLIVALVLVLRGGDDPSVAQNEPPSKHEEPEPVEDPSAASQSPSKTEDPGAEDPSAEDPSAEVPGAEDPGAEDPAGKDPATSDPASADPAGTGSMDDDPEPEPPPSEGSGSDNGTEPEGSEPEKPAPSEDPKPTEPESPSAASEGPSEESPGGIFSSSKLPEPDEQAQKKAEAQIREVFSFSGNLSKTKRLELADQLLQSGLETKDDPAARFVLLRMAAQMAAKAGDVEKTAKILDQVGELYEASLLEIKAQALAESANSAGSGPQAVAANMLVVRTAKALVEEAIDDDDYQTASFALEQVALPAARRTGDRRLTAEISKGRGELKRLEDRFAKVEEAIASLKDEPDDPDASLVAGSWYCLFKGKWEKGLPYLANAGQADLASAAKLDLSAPQEAAARVKVGDAWWKLGEDKNRSEEEVKRLRARAVSWYQKAHPEVSGLVKIKVENRIKESGAAVGEWVLRFDGTRSFVVIPNALYDGTYPITLEGFATPASYDQTMTILGNFPRDTTSGSQRGGLRIGMHNRYWDFELYVKPSSVYSTYPRVRYVNANDYSNIGRRTHLAGVFNGQTMKLYVDGRLVDTKVDVGVHKSSAFPFLVGADPEKGSALDAMRTQKHFDGVIESVRISNFARYTQDTFNPPDKLQLDRNTLLLLEFNQGEGDVVANAASSKMPAKIMGARWVEREKWLEECKALQEANKPSFGPRFGRPRRPDPPGRDPKRRAPRD